MRVIGLLNGLELFGHERGNIEVFKVLRERGAAVRVGINSADGGGDVGAYLRELGFETFGLPFSNQWSWRWFRRQPSIVYEKSSAVLRCSQGVSQQIRRFKPTHLHVGSPLAFSYVLPALLLHRVPLVYRMGDCPPEGSRFNLLLWRLAVRRSAAVAANSDFVRAAAMQHGAANVSVIYNTVPTRPAAAAPLARAPGMPPRTYLAYVGAVAEHKGLLPLLEALRMLHGEMPQLHLDIVGGSRYDQAFRQQLAQRIAESGLEANVTLHGAVPDPAPFYRRATVHVAPSVWDEPLGNVVLEAKREGTPSIVFASGGLVELVNHQRDGFICQEKTAAALADGLRWMLGDDERLARMRHAAREDLERRFARAAVAAAWAGLYRSTLAGAPA
jgi:glycosyltransferase involved in cell wall biosynthesis